MSTLTLHPATAEQIVDDGPFKAQFLRAIDPVWGLNAALRILKPFERPRMAEQKTESSRHGEHRGFDLAA